MFKWTDLYLRIIFLFPLFTLIQSYINFVNKIIFFFLFVVQFILFIKNGIQKSSFYRIVIVFVLETIALLNTVFPLYNLNDIFYLPYLIIYFEYIIYNKQDMLTGLKRNMNFIKTLIYLWTGLVLISIFLPNSYGSEWGDGRYFQSFAGSPFRLGPAALFIMVLVLAVMILENRRKFIVWAIVPMFCFFSGGSRIYFGIGVLLFIIVWYKFFYDKTKFWMSLIPIAVLGILLFFQSSIWDKVIATSYTEDSYFDFWGTVTSSRSIFWIADINAFNDLKVFNRIVGNGFNFVYDVNYQAVKSRIWAHNDFIQVLMTYGYVGLIVYIYSVYRLFKNMTRVERHSKVLLCIVFAIWLLNAFFNMFYTYFCSMLCFPILMILLTSEISINKNG